MIAERFYADSGANRTVHPSSLAAQSFYRYPLQVGTASGAKALQSEGVGSMKLFTADGEPMPGFERIIFCKGVAEKLASVGEWTCMRLYFNRFDHLQNF